MTDAIGMRSAADLAGPQGGADAAVRALEAGADLILMGTRAERVAVDEAFRGGTLAKPRTHGGCLRAGDDIEKTPGSFPRRMRRRPPRLVHVTVMNNWIEKSLTWFNQPAQTLSPTAKMTSLAPWEAFHAKVLEICPKDPPPASCRISVIFAGTIPTQMPVWKGQVRELLALTQPGETVLLGTYAKVDLQSAARLQEAGRKIYVIHAGNPVFAPLAENIEGPCCFATPRVPRRPWAWPSARFSDWSIPPRLCIRSA